MKNSLQTALVKLTKKSATPDQIELIRRAFTDGQIFIGGNVQNSVIVVGSGNTIELNVEALEQLTAVNNRSSLHQLPQPPVDFVGREQELKKILKSLGKKNGAAISGLVGMGGIGKTALGLVAAHSLVEKYSEAQFFIDMRGTNQEPLKPLDVMKHVIQSVYPTADLKNATETELAGAYQSVLSEKKSIVFLDNAYDATQVAPLLPPANCIMLLTSRVHFTVSGLYTVKLDVLKEKDAVQLLAEICPRLTKTDARHIAKLCGYLPIALRLASSYLSVHTTWTAEEYIVSLSDKTKRLESLNLKGADINITASFELSYLQFPPEEQRYWNMLAVFPASFKRDAIASVWDIDDETARKLSDKFCQYSLLDYDLATDRYQLHDLLGDFASSKLIESERVSAYLRYLQHYRNQWINAENLYAKGNDNINQGVILFGNESTHFATAYDWASENATNNQKILPILKELPKTISLLPSQQHPNLQIKWFNSILFAAQQHNDKVNESKSLGSIGVAYDNSGDRYKAINYFEQALNIAYEIEDRQYQGIWLGSIGKAYFHLSENRKAIEYFEQALAIANEIGDLQRQGIWLGNIGLCYATLVEMRKAISYLEQALKIAHKIGDWPNFGAWVGNTGNIYAMLGEFPKALKYMKQALEYSREIGDQRNIGTWLGNIGGIYAYQGDDYKSIEYYEQALRIAYNVNDKERQAVWLKNIGGSYSNAGQDLKALRYGENALKIAQGIGHRSLEGDCLGIIGSAYGNMGKNSEAINYYELALVIAREIEDRKHEAEWLNQLGELCIKISQFQKAKKNIESGLQIAREIGIRNLEAKCLFSFANYFKANQDINSALQYAQQAQEIFKSLEMPELAEVDQFIEALNQTS